MYLPIFQQMKKHLAQLDKWLVAAAAYADAKKFEPKQFLGLRLVVDQFDFAKQVQGTCDVAKLAAARLSGKDAPVHEDNEQTLEQLRARVASVISYLDGYTAKDFADAATRTITNARWKGETMTGADYFLEHALPNFYFHLTTAYAILRANGVPIGKSDFLGALTKQPAK